MITLDLQIDFTAGGLIFTTDVLVDVTIIEDQGEAGVFRTMEIEGWEYKTVPFYTNDDINADITAAIGRKYDDVFEMAMEAA